MQLSRKNLEAIREKQSPDRKIEARFDLPEKILQFGTGVLLRGLPDFFVEMANRQGIFNGRIVVVKTTASDDSAFDAQDGLYTICVRGKEQGQILEENIVSSVVSRVLKANTQWKEILDCASNPALTIIISNTTELGIQLTDDRITDQPPVSFPGKLLAFLYARYKTRGGHLAEGCTIIPTELIDNNGQKLEGIVLELAHRNNLEVEFIDWLEKANHFCNSLVDRIVPGRPVASEAAAMEASLGYEDKLLLVCEPFRLWAIEGNEETRENLGFYGSDKGMVIVPDINQYRELKLRLLNGTHTFHCGLALLAGFNLTRETVDDRVFSVFMKYMVFDEIMPSIPLEIETEIKREFAEQVLGRFGNPFIDHFWKSIAVQYSAKMKSRNIPLILEYYRRFNELPTGMALCFAAYLRYMKPSRKAGEQYFGECNGIEYEIQDQSAAMLYEAWSGQSPQAAAEAVLRNNDYWGRDLAELPGFLTAVQEFLLQILSGQLMNLIESHGITKRITA